MIPLDDRGLTLGDGLFETLLAVDGDLIDLEPHLARMIAGCAALDLPPPDPAEAQALCRDALAGQAGRMAVRLTLTAGSGGRGLDRPAVPNPVLFATAAPAPLPAGPARLATVDIRRNPSSPAARFKTLAYLDNVLARRQAQAAGADEALMLNTDGEVACAAVANVFWFEGGQLRTPALGCGVLDGILRGRVLTRAAALGMDVAEGRWPRSALNGAQTIFLTNSLIGVRAVSVLDGRPLAPDDARLAALTP
jgi:branched-subunit amino acid aminotransferase/4-amino-4-deoxychorismate lyase